MQDQQLLNAALSEQPALHWRPSASLAQLRQRSALLQQVRTFFAQRQVLEVDTPLLSAYGVTDPYLHNICTQQGEQLQTSPEYAMKRLLAAGYGAIYQICKAFRQGDQGRWHHPEFTLLEWYRPGWAMSQLIDEVLMLCTDLLGERPCVRWHYRQAWLQSIQIDPWHSATADLLALAQHCAGAKLSLSRDEALDIIMSHRIQPQLPRDTYVIIDQFPASQAALAQLEQDDAGVTVARRFELYYNGIELANGYQELTDLSEHQQRFAQDNRMRQAFGLAQQAVDPRLLAAVQSGLPDCAGVALGLDRLLMLAMGCTQIAQVLSFAEVGSITTPAAGS